MNPFCHCKPIQVAGLIVGILFAWLPSTLLGEDAGIEDSEPMEPLRQMRDFYHGWTTQEGIWSQGERDGGVKAALKGTGNDKKDYMVLGKAGLVPFDIGRKGIQMFNRHLAYLAKLQIAEELASQYSLPELASRARITRNKLKILQSREKALFMKNVRKDIVRNNPSLVETASGGEIRPPLEP